MSGLSIVMGYCWLMSECRERVDATALLLLAREGMSPGSLGSNKGTREWVGACEGGGRGGASWTLFHILHITRWDTQPEDGGQSLDLMRGVLASCNDELPEARI